MKKQTYKEQNGLIIGVEGEQDYKTFSFPRFNLDVLVTKTILDSYGESYFNVYILDNKFKIEPLNNLHENIPLENEPKDWESYLLVILCQYVIWRDYNYNVTVQDVEDNS